MIRIIIIFNNSDQITLMSVIIMQYTALKMIAKWNNALIF